MTPRRTDSWVTALVLVVGTPWLIRQFDGLPFWWGLLALFAAVGVTVSLVQLTVFIVLSLTEDAVVALRRGGRDDDRGTDAV